MRSKICKTSWMGLVMLFGVFTACSDKKGEDSPVVDKEDSNSPSVEVSNETTELNTKADKFLKDYYLWNDEYKGMTVDLTIPYKDSYDNFVETTLMKMNTNKLDKKKGENGNYVLYSYWDRKDKKVSSKGAVRAAVNHGIEKEDKITTFGISSMAIVSFMDKSGTATNEYAFSVQSVYPDSPASSFGIKRGTFIYEVDGMTITGSNYMSLYLNLVSPTASSVTLLAGDGTEEPQDVYLETAELDPSPIILNSVIEKDGHKIGYLVYDSFHAGYDNDLLKVMADYKSSGVTDFVLDLRYNGGGHMVSSMMLSACMAGSKCKGKIFQYYRYNDARMKTVDVTKRVTGNDYDSSAGYFYSHFYYDNYFSINLDSYTLNLDRLYVLTTSSTASASEVLINALRGIDMEVVLIGEKTNGKNVGMEVDEFEHGNYSYELAPITFQYYNAKKKTVSENGMEPDFQVMDWDSNIGYVDFGEEKEPLLAKALAEITKTPTTVSETRSASNIKMEKMSVELPNPMKKRPQGAIVFHPEMIE